MKTSPFAMALAILVCIMVVRENSTTENKSADTVSLILEPPLKHKILIETVNKIFSTIMPRTKITFIRAISNPINKVDLFDFENTIKGSFYKKYYQFLQMDGQNITAEPLQLQRNVLMVTDTYEGFR